MLKLKRLNVDITMNAYNHNPENAKELWRKVNQLIGKTSKTTCITSLKVNENTTITGEANIANSLNDYFSNIGSDLSSQIPDSETNPSDYLKKCSNSFRFEEITISMVLHCINNPKSTKASGIDKILSNL